MGRVKERGFSLYYRYVSVEADSPQGGLLHVVCRRNGANAAAVDFRLTYIFAPWEPALEGLRPAEWAEIVRRGGRARA